MITFTNLVKMFQEAANPKFTSSLLSYIDGFPGPGILHDIDKGPFASEVSRSGEVGAYG